MDSVKNLELVGLELSYYIARLELQLAQHFLKRL